MNNVFLVGQICVSDIPKELIREVTLRDGSKKKFLDICVGTFKAPKTFQNANGTIKTHTHYISCAPPMDKRVDGVNYFIGNLEDKTRPQVDTALDPFN